MSFKELRTFADIRNAVVEELKIQTTDTTNLDRISRDINMVYLDEVLPYSEWPWGRKRFDYVISPYISTGTVSVAQNSNTVTFSSVVTKSKSNWLLIIEGDNEIYEIDTHAGGSATAYLKTNYIETTNSVAKYKLFQRGVLLPVDMSEVLKVWHDNNRYPLEAMADRKFLDLVLNAQQTEGRPCYYKVSEPIDPNPYDVISGFPASTYRTSEGNVRALTFASTVAPYLEVGDKVKISVCGNTNYKGEFVVENVSTNTIYYTASDEFDELTTSDATIVLEKEDLVASSESPLLLELYPFLSTSSTLLHIEGVKKVTPLENDDDEPILPIHDRIVILYGALYRAWTRKRNMEEAGINLQLFNKKIEKMVTKIGSSTDFPQLQVSDFYSTGKRLSRRQKDSWRNF